MQLQVEQHQINRSHPLWKVVDEYCYYAKNLYNAANYIIRQEFISTYKETGKGHWLRYREMDKLLQGTPEYKQLMSQASQCTLQVLDKNWKSFMAGLGKYNKNPKGFTGRPRMPKYREKDGRNVWYIKNALGYMKDGKLHLRLKSIGGYGFSIQTDKRIVSMRFVPRGNNYVFEIVYEVEDVEQRTDNGRVIGIDLGINNFATISNNIGEQPIIINGKGIKSVNQFYNKQKANLQSDLMLRNGKYNSRKINNLNLKRFNRIKNFMHNASKFVIEYCVKNDVNIIMIGKNDGWKQEANIGSVNNQKMLYIPYEQFIKQLEYKAYNAGIAVIQTEESYTSGTSFLDEELPVKENYNNKRRIERGLFKSNNGTFINSDVNGSLQIIKKVFPNAFADGIEVCLTPVVINVTKVA